VALRFRPWHLAWLLMLVATGLVGGVYLWRVRSASEVARLAARLPRGEFTVAHIDLRALRVAGLLRVLARPDGEQEAEYRDFVRETDFDYARDLDTVLAAFGSEETFALLVGRFDWGRLIAFVDSRGGDCYNGFCRVPSGKPNRWISFFAVTPSIMGLAASRDSWAASALLEEREPAPLRDPPAQPVWLTFPGGALKRATWLPPGTRAFVSPVAGAERVTVALGASASGYEAVLEVRCRTPEEAARVARQLTEVTEALNRMIRLENKEPNPRDLSGVLTAGVFTSRETRVEGRWPVPAEFLQALAEGSE
jgi:hypothetical protein